MTEDASAFEGTLAVIGGGRMGEAIVGGLLSRRRSSRPIAITVAEPSAAAPRRRSPRAFGVRCVADGARGASGRRRAARRQAAGHRRGRRRRCPASSRASLVVSIAAGVSCARLESLLPAGTAVVRVMPNTPALVGEGMAVVSGGSEATAEQVELVRALFAATRARDRARRALPGCRDRDLGLGPGVLRARRRRARACRCAPGAAARRRAGARDADDARHRRAARRDRHASRGARRRRLESRRHDDRGGRGARGARRCVRRSPRRSPRRSGAPRSSAREPVSAAHHRRGVGAASTRCSSSSTCSCRGSRCAGILYDIYQRARQPRRAVPRRLPAIHPADGRPRLLAAGRVFLCCSSL